MNKIMSDHPFYKDIPVYNQDTFAPDRVIRFKRDGEVVGVLDLNGPEIKFTGNADASAKVFFECVGKYFANSESGGPRP